jgi:hypothetical protein
MADFTKFVRSLTAASQEKDSRLSKGVGLPFWIGVGACFLGFLFFFSALAGAVSGPLIAAISLLAAIIGGVLVQVIFDLARGIKGGEVHSRYLAVLVSIVVLAFTYGVIYYRTPESGFERVFAMASLVIISALFGYVVGRAKG